MNNLLTLDYLNAINSSSKVFFESIHSPILTEIMLIVTDVGSPSSVILYCLVISMVLWLHKKYAHMTQFILTIGASGLVALLTKIIVRLPRPSGGLVSEIGYSFASAHAMVAVTFFMLIAYSYKNSFKSKLAKYALFSLSALATLLIGLSRVYLGVHYMTDVLAGFLIGSIIVGISILLYEKQINREDN